MIPLHSPSDPDTSRLAAESHAKSGRLSTNRQRVIQGVIDNPGLCSDELADLIGMQRHEAARRLADCKNLGLLTYGESRRSSKGGRMCVTWLPAMASVTTEPEPKTQARLW